MSLSEYFEQHEEQAFVAKALATAVSIIFVKNYLSGLLGIYTLVMIVVPAIKSYRGDYVQIALSAEFIK